MKYTALGPSGLQLSPVALGAMNFGASEAACDEAEARRIIHAFLDSGNTVIDTADGYGGGTSEEVVGRAVADRRGEVVLATKGWLRTSSGTNESGMSRAHLTRALDASLRRLGTDYIDLYQWHRWDQLSPIEETMATLDGFVRDGKVRSIGCSNFTAAQIVEAQWAADRIGGTSFISVQAQHSLIAREVESEVLATCATHGLGVLAYGALAGGVLAGRYQRNVEPPPGSRLALWSAMAGRRAGARTLARALLDDRNLRIADTVADVAGRMDTTAAAVSTAWVAGRPDTTTVIVGPRSLAQLESSLAGAELILPPTERTLLDTVSRPQCEPTDGTSRPVTDDDPVEVVRRQLERISHGLDASVADAYAKDAVVHQPFAGAGQYIRGREALRAHFEAAAGLPLRLRARDVVFHGTTDPDVVIVEYDYEATVTTTGATFTTPNVQVVCVRGGRIVWSRDYHHPTRISEILQHADERL